MFEFFISDQHETTEARPGTVRTVHHGHPTFGNQTGVTAGESEISGTGTIPGNWNSLSPTLSFQMSTMSRSTSSGGGGISTGYGYGSSSSTTHYFPPAPSSSAAAAVVETTATAHETLGPLPISTSTKHHHGFFGHGISTTSQSFHFHGGVGRDKLAEIGSSSHPHTHQPGGGSSVGGRSHGASQSKRKGESKLITSFVEPPVPLAAVASSSRVTGPYFESNRTTIHMTARAGQTVLLDCAVILLQGRTVSLMFPFDLPFPTVLITFLGSPKLSPIIITFWLSSNKSIVSHE